MLYSILADTLLLNQVDDTLLLILTAQAEKLVTCK